MIDDRDYVGYGANPPDPQWPGGARIAVNINLNFEGGGERSVMDGDGVSEGLLNDIGMPSLPGLRSPMVESVFEYGSRVGGWRLLRLLRRFGVKVCVLAVAKAAERNPEITRAFVEDGHEIVSHGYRWLDYQTMPEEVEREHVRLGIETIERIAAVRPLSKGLSFDDPSGLKGVAYRQIAGQIPTARLALAYRRGEVSPVVRNFITRAVS